MAESITPIVFENVSKVYHPRSLWHRQVQALREMTFSIRMGEVFGILGPNRAGKTTILKILLSVARPSSGRVERFGKPLHDRSALARIGYMHEKQAFPGYLTATQLLHFYGTISGLSNAKLRNLVPQLITQVRIADRAHEPILQFSKGMMQRLALAQAMLNEPDLLVLDEPAEGLDILGRQLIKEVVLQQRAAGRATLLVTHNILDVEELCDRMIVLGEGRKLFEGTVTELKQTAPDSDRPLQTAMERLYTLAFANTNSAA